MTNPLLKLRELAQLRNKATVGPWEFDEGISDGYLAGGDDTHVISLDHGYYPGDSVRFDISDGNKDFITAAANFPYAELIQEVGELRQTLADIFINTHLVNNFTIVSAYKSDIDFIEWGERAKSILAKWGK